MEEPSIVEVQTSDAPQPAGTYSQAIIHQGLLYISGQTPRLPDGTRIMEASFEDQTRAAMNNLKTIAEAAGTSLTRAIYVTVYLRDPDQGKDFDAIYRQYLGQTPPARAIVQSSLTIGALEISAVVAMPTESHSA